jgi:hypothetical protein
MNKGPPFQVRVYIFSCTVDKTQPLIIIFCCVCLIKKEDSLCRFKKNMRWDSNHAFILGALVYMVANSPVSEPSYRTLSKII